MIKLYTDGSSTGKVGDGGWGFVIVEDDKILYEASGSGTETTNNRMELMGVIEGLKYIASNYSTSLDLEVYSDSQYVVKGLTEWYSSWEEKMIRGKVIPNQDLWLDLKSLSSLFENLQMKWVRGHSGNEFNDKCDSLAKTARLSITNEL